MKPKYLVGYKGNNDVWNDSDNYDKNSIESITNIKTARKTAKEFDMLGETVIIYKLVPVEEKKVKENR